MAKTVLDVGGFSIIKRIGSGARSTIYLAKDLQNKKEVALKRVIMQKPEDKRVFEQVRTEYKVARKVDNPYVRKCYKLKKIRGLSLRTKELLLSMEYFDGTSLEEGPTRSLVDILLIFRMVAKGLDAMHRQKIVHCDIKPNNILVGESGNLKIIDLGQSCEFGTTKKRIQGTPDYIAPEQVNREALGPKTDIFNLGATMFWALTGENIPTLIPKKDKLGREIQKPKKAPHEITSQIPADISRLVMDCVQDERLKRPARMLDVIHRLDSIIHQLIGDKIKVKKNAAGNS
jgi:serine/threonine-protein kinase